MWYVVVGDRVIPVPYERDEDANFLNKDWWTTATPEDIEIEIKKGADVNAKDNNGNNILMYAVTSGNLVLVKYIVNSSIVDINEKNNDDKTAKDIAIAHNQTEIAKFLEQKV